MRWFDIFPSLIALACCVRADMAGALKSLFGLTFTPTAVIASRFNASGSVELTKQHLTLEYQQYYRDAVHHFDAQQSDKPRTKNEALLHDAAIPVSARELDETARTRARLCSAFRSFCLRLCRHTRCR